ncbi:hypothetical protein ACQP2Y_13105 [Actinoplanes sp. CA-051413]|uniref:hypothetical protein n=1 Tax=Actinoplanes sp. CA-051413 TaxID=3239899 RepID=UPI003D95F374
MAVQLLEQGRSVLWARSLHLRGDLTELEECSPELFAALQQARDALERFPPQLRKWSMPLSQDRSSRG